MDCELRSYLGADQVDSINQLPMWGQKIMVLKFSSLDCPGLYAEFSLTGSLEAVGRIQRIEGNLSIILGGKCCHSCNNTKSGI